MITSLPSFDLDQLNSVDDLIAAVELLLEELSRMCQGKASFSQEEQSILASNVTHVKCYYEKIERILMGALP